METFQKPVTFMYFWLNYCDENHIERIPVGVKDIDHLFNIAGEVYFCFLTAPELMIMNT